jgi:hypothetical protein
MTTEHTPTPWQTQCEFFIVGGNPETTVADTVCQRQDSPQWTANAAFIVKACNAHNKLVEALRWYVEANPAFRSMPIGAPGSPMRLKQEEALRMEDAALALLEKVTP